MTHLQNFLKWGQNLILSPFVLLTLTACAPTLESRLAELSAGAARGESAAVTWIYDERSGAVTALGDRYRDQVEAALRAQGVTVKARKEMGLIIDDLDSFGNGRREADLWKQAGTDLMAGGYYTIIQPRAGEKATVPYARLTVKLLRVADVNIVRTFTAEFVLPPDWAHLAAQVKGNAYQKAVETVTDHSASAGPKLAARLDRSPACYLSGAAGKVIVDTEPGSHVYLLNLAADRTVTLLYPNSIMTDQPLPVGHWQYPPPALEKDVQLVFFPLDERETIQEGIKVIASRYPLDFSFLPVPENTIYAGAQGGDMRKVAEVLKGNFGWSERVLEYWVGPECR